MILPIYLYGSTVLRKDNAEADLNDREGISKLVSDMWETLKEADGCGLAAPQVGVNVRVLIADGTDMSDTYEYLKDFRRTMINPVVLEESDSTCEFSEGCLSVPGIYAEVRRPSSMTVEYYDENLEKKTEFFDGFACRIIQHELGHLEGEVFVAHISPIRRKMIARKLQGISKGAVSTRYKTKK
ncbi:MAG: peptide deformylase [Bacteroidales bacterium]|nr:peptide deformylase [Bacteroidales bacterium]